VLGRQGQGLRAQLTAPRRAVHAYGRAGDWLLFDGKGQVLTLAATKDLPGHRPLYGALLDVGDSPKGEVTDTPDPLLWMRAAWVDKDGGAHLLFASQVDEATCDGGAQGAAVSGKKDGVTLKTTICPGSAGGFVLQTQATDLPAGASVADELNPGSAEPRLADAQAGWEGERTGKEVLIDEHDLELRLSHDAGMRLRRRLVHIAGETFPAPLFAVYTENPARRTLNVRRLPPGKAATPTGSIHLAYTDSEGASLPVHVLFRGEEGTPDPVVASGPSYVGAGRSAYLRTGQAQVSLPPGRYQVVATHGPSFTLAKTSVQIGTDAKAEAHGTLTQVVDSTGWTSADFHLHSAPSPDSKVALDERVTSLLAEGVDFAVATDHNRISTFAPLLSKAEAQKLGTLDGCEITSAGNPPWGHFNAFPLTLPTGAPEDGVPPYYEVTPTVMWAGARELGARIIQVNHARMPPSIGYFDQAKVEAATGKAQSSFDDGFDALEAHNGLWLENRERVREGLMDLVAMARRGRFVAATGNSDSHRLLFEEAGWPRTWVRTPTSPRDDLGDRVISTLLHRETMISAGPFVDVTVDGEPPGHTLVPKTKGKVTLHVRVLAPAWIPVGKVEVLKDDATAMTFDIKEPEKDGVRFDKTFDVVITRDTAISVWVESDKFIPDVLPLPRARPIAFTGLFLVDANDDGKITIAPR
jgi:hypothetical protein